MHGFLSFATFVGETAEAKPPEDEIVEIVHRIRESQAFVEDGFEKVEEEQPDPVKMLLAEQKARAENEELEIPCREEVSNTMAVIEADTAAPDQKMFMPKNGKTTLHKVMQHHDTFESAKSDLWRLNCFLRLAPEGCDGELIPNHCLTRKKISNGIKKWQNLLRHRMAAMDAQNAGPALRQRASRAAAWAQHQEDVRKKHMPSLPPSVVLEVGQVVAVELGCGWGVGLLMTLYRIYKKGNGAQPFPHEISRGSLHSARIVLMEEVDENRGTGQYRCQADSLAMVVSSEKIGVRLDGASSKMHLGIDGQMILLGED